MRYAAIVCVVVGGLFMGGAGVVAFATPDTGAGGTQNNGNGSPVGGFRLPQWSGLPGSGNSALGQYTVGPIAPPVMNLPKLLVPTSLSPNVSSMMLPGPATSGLNAPASAPLTVPAPNPGPSALLTSADTSLPDNLQTADPPTPPPAISVLPVPRVPVGQPVKIDNSLPDQLPIDLQNPIVPQLLPPPLVLILMAVAERVPLAGLVITPVLTAKIPQFIPELLSATMVPTLSLGPVAPAATVPNVSSLAKPASLSDPTELGVMGMDVPQAPELTPAPPTVEPPHWTSPSGNGLTALSDPVAFRSGYSDYLRNAGMAQITAIAVPGAAAILLFTFCGGFIGYRQARAGHVIKAEGMTRFLR